MVSRRSSAAFQKARWLSNQAEAVVIPSAESRQRCRRPSIRRSSSPDSSSTRMCREIAGCEIGNADAISPTLSGPRASRSTIRRRVGSARAPKTASKRCSLTIMLYNNIVKSAHRQGAEEQSGPGSNNRSRFACVDGTAMLRYTPTFVAPLAWTIGEPASVSTRETKARTGVPVGPLACHADSLSR